MTENTILNVLIRTPKGWASLNGPKGRSFLLYFRISNKAIERRYDVYCPITVRETMALNAVVEPIFKRPNKNMTKATRPMVRIGMRYSLSTCAGRR